MFCKNCGSQIDDNASVCVHCGVPTNPAAKHAEKRTNVLAIVGFLLSFFIPLAGVICSAISYKNADREFGGDGKNFALAGIIISAVYLALYVVAIVLCAVLWLPTFINVWTSILAA